MENKKTTKLSAASKMIAASALAAVLFISGAHAQTQEIKGETVGASTTVTAKVLSVDQKTRKVKIETTDGKKYSFIAGPNVVNLPQVKKGDMITAVYTEAIGYEVRKHNKQTGVAVTDAAAAAQPGQMPAGAVMQQTTVAVTIVAIDSLAPSVTFKNPEGEIKTVKIKDPQKLVGVKVGDVVDITYTEALAIKVDPAVK